MIFKSKRDELLWQFVNRELKFRVEALAAWAYQKHSRNIVVSDTLRTLDEQKKLNAEIVMKNPGYRVSYPSVHNYGNGVDLSHYDDKGLRWTNDQMFEMRDWFNETFPYSIDPEIKTQSAVYHEGKGAHIHLQINAREHGNGINPNHDMSNRLLLAAIESLNPKPKV